MEATREILFRAGRNVKRNLRQTNAEITRPLQEMRGTSQTSERPTSLYQALPEDHIRLLTIEIVGGVVQCRLIAYPQHLAPKYDAVSYCWGQDLTTVGITCNGFELRVRHNLLAFLKASGDMKSPRRPLWIDAICLNQADDREKAVQVPRMAKIYKQASRTIVWLGEPDADTENALLYLTVAVPQWIERGDKKFDKATRIKVMADKEYAGKWQSVADYLSRPWFDRLWCLQEVLLSEDIYFLPHTPRIPYISWKKLYECVMMVENEMGSLMELGTDLPDTSLSHPALTGALSSNIGYLEIYRNGLRSSQHLGVSNIRGFANHRQCSEPVDRVWAFLGTLATDLGNQIREAGIIDYSPQAKKEYWTSYLGFMMEVYKYNSDEFFEVVLSDVGRAKNDSLPSWCPDFNQGNEYVSFSDLRKFRAGFTNSKDQTEIISKLSASGELSILGFQVDVVTACTPISWKCDTSLMEDEHKFFGTVHSWLMNCRKICEVATKKKEVTKILCHTLVAADNSREGNWREIENLPGVYQQMERNCATRANGQGDFVLDGPYDTYFWEYNEVCDGRVVFATLDGRVGLGPPSLQEGDVICAFVGAEALFALRAYDRHGNTARRYSSSLDSIDCKLIGDAYIHGLMNGEAFEVQHKESKHANRYFNLV